jgi:transposase InsO family protein
VCLALVAAFRRYGIPDEILTDNGKQFTARFNPGGGETMFERILRQNGVIQRLTKPRSPTNYGQGRAVPVRHVAPGCIPGPAGRNSKGGSWA